MPEITKVILGRPGPPGAGVSASEKASFVTLAAANVFTAKQTIRGANSPMFVVEDSAEANKVLFNVDPLYDSITAANGAMVQGFSDLYVTQTWNIDSATGNAQFDGYVKADGGIRGDVVTLTLPIIDGGGSAISTGIKADFGVPYNCTVTGWTLLADVTGSISIELWMDTYANYPPTVADLISGTTGSNNPRISSSNKATSTTLTNWTTALVKDRIIRMNVASAATITRAALLLHVTRT